MNLTIKSNNLFISLKKLSTLISKNNSNPILENILFKTKKKNLFLTSTNLDTEITIKNKKVKIYKDGEITIPGKKILDIARKLKKESKINLCLKNEKLKITAKNIFFILSTIKADSFPKLKKTKIEKKFFIPEKTLKKMIDSTFFSMANQDVRHYLNGTLLKAQKNRLTLITTDGYRLSKAETIFKKNPLNFSIIIPRKSILELRKILNHTENKVEIRTTNNYISIKIKNLSFTSILIEGNFPNCEKILISKTFYTSTIVIKQLKESLLKISILAHETFHSINFQFYKKKLKISTQNNNDEYAEEIIQAFSKIYPIYFSINVKYILEILSVLKKKNISISCNKEISKIQIQEKDKNILTTYLLMPLKI